MMIPPGCKLMSASINIRTSAFFVGKTVVPSSGQEELAWKLKFAKPAPKERRQTLSEHRPALFTELPAPTRPANGAAALARQHCTQRPRCSRDWHLQHNRLRNGKA